MSDTLITADANREMFDQIASRYDLTNRVISLGLDKRWRRKAVKALNPSPGKLYLDIGCGTGDVMLEMLRQSPDCKVTGVDPAANMVNIARTKLDKAGCSGKAGVITSDACKVPFDDHHFDGAISAFCIRNISDRRKALKELKRLLKPDSQLVILELTAADNSFVKPFYWIFTRLVVPVAGVLTGNREAYRYLVESIRDFSANAELEDLMKECGFNDVRAIQLNCGVVTIFVGQCA